MNAALPHIAITTGEPAGIGPDLCVLITQQTLNARITFIGDAHMLQQRAQQLNVPFNVPTFANAPNAPFSLMHVSTAQMVVAGQLNAANSPYVLNTLTAAMDGCANQTFAAMVTAPVHKGVINDAGIAFSGHTEFLAEHTNTPKVVMMLVGGGLRVALVTTHLPLAQVPAAINQAELEKIIRILYADLQTKFGIANPHIFITGLNPHAGEGGYLGREEIETIQPVIEQLKQQGIQLTGALPADTMFSPKNIALADAFLCMYHDQGLPVLKYASFGAGVNITLGLPIIRTSVDHGTALDLAGTGKIEIGSMLAAIELAVELAHRKN